MKETPSALRVRMSLKSASISRSVSAAVGSSSTRIRARRAIALEISIICCCATESRRAGTSSGRTTPSFASASVARSTAALTSRNMPRTGSFPSTMFCTAFRSGTKLNSWYIIPMPSRSASRGPPIVTSSPSISIVPESAGCAPARIFMSVDLPAPFSPTSACTSARSTSRSTPSSARTPGNVLTIPRMRSSGACIVLVCVSLRELSDGDVDLLGRRLAGEVIVDRVDRQFSDLIGMLNRIAVHLAVLDGGARFGCCIVADHDDLTRQAGGLDRGHRTQRGVVVDAEYALEIFVGLQQVLHYGTRLGALAAAADVGDDLGGGAILSERLFEALDAILHAGYFGLVDDRDRAGVIRQPGAHQLSRFRPALHVVARDVRDDGALLCGARDVCREDGDFCLVCLHDCAADGLRIIRRQDDGVGLLRDEVLDLGLLFGVVAAGIDDVERVAVFGRFALHAGDHRLVELRFHVLNRDVDRLSAAAGRRCCTLTRRAGRAGARLIAPHGKDRHREKDGDKPLFHYRGLRYTRAPPPAEMSALSKSAMISRASSIPHDSRSVLSPTPSARRCSGVRTRCELRTLQEIVVATSPKLWTIAMRRSARKNAST